MAIFCWSFHGCHMAALLFCPSSGTSCGPIMQGAAQAAGAGICRDELQSDQVHEWHSITRGAIAGRSHHSRVSRPSWRQIRHHRPCLQSTFALPSIQSLSRRHEPESHTELSQWQHLGCMHCMSAQIVYNFALQITLFCTSGCACWLLGESQKASVQPFMP